MSGQRHMPRGTGLVGVGMVVNAGAAYGHLAAAGRSLSTVGMSGLSLLWTIAFSAGIGLFFPLEQELTRAVAARVATGEPTSPLLRRGFAVAAALLAAALALIALAHTPLTRSAFNNDPSLVWSLAGALTALAATHTTRGLLAGHGLFPAYATQLTLDGLLRLTLSAALLLTGSHSPTAFALILTAAPLTATLAVLPQALRATAQEPRAKSAPPAVAANPPQRRSAADNAGPPPTLGADHPPAAVSRHSARHRPQWETPSGTAPSRENERIRPPGRREMPEGTGPHPNTAGPTPHPRPPGRDEIRRGLTPLICGALLAQALANAPVLGAKALTPHDAALITALLCALTLVRIPQFLVGALQAALLRDLADRAARGDRAGLARGIGSSAGGLLTLGVLCTVPAALAGPAVTERLLAAPPVLGHADFALLGLGTTGYLLAYLLGNGTLATGGQRRQLLAWAAGTAVTAAVMLLPGATRLRVEYAYAAGSWTAAALLATRLAYTLRRAPGPETRAGTPAGDATAAAGRNRAGTPIDATAAAGPHPAATPGNAAAAPGRNRAGPPGNAPAAPGPHPAAPAAQSRGAANAGAATNPKPRPTKGDLSMPDDTTSAGYTARLLAPGGSTLRRMLPTQVPYRWNLRRLRLGRVLDVGCGVGRNLRNCDPGSVGVDHNAHSVAAARDLGLTAYTPDEFGGAAGCAPGSFDSLLCAHVLEHLDEDTGAGLLATYLPYLRPGGRAVFITPQEAGFRSDATHVRFVGFAELAAQARTAGLTVRRTYSFPLPRAAGKLFRYNEFVVVTTAPAAHPAEMASATEEL